MTSALVAGILAGYGIALPVGAVATYLVALGAREPLPVATAAALGVATTDGLFAAVAAYGGGRLYPVLRPLSDPLTCASVAVLVLLALRTVTAAVRRHRDPASRAVGNATRLTVPRAYAGLLGLTALNPATIAYFAALVLGEQSRTIGGTATSGALFAIGALVASGSWQLVLAGGGAMLGRVLTGRRAQLGLGVASSVVMVLLAAHLLLA